MHVLNVRNVNEALPSGLDYLRRQGIQRESRNGPVLVAPGPVTTMYRKPKERVIFWPERDANPFFHLMESLWMLAGRNDIAFLTRYVQRMKQFSDDGVTQHGAYGHRWLRHFLMVQEDGQEVGEINQLATIAQMLQRNPEERRCVLAMWDPSVDLARNGKDLPCNTHAYISRGADGQLNITVCCRSNDLIWGAYGANAVHFSVMQEFMAALVGCEVGVYYQMSNNYHAYMDTLEPITHLADQAPDPFRASTRDPYTAGVVEPFPLVQTPPEEWLQDLEMFLDEGPVIGLRDPFFRKVATPIEQAHQAFKSGEGRARYERPLEILERCAASDWRRACHEWLLRRLHKFERASDDGPGHDG